MILGRVIVKNLQQKLSAACVPRRGFAVAGAQVSSDDKSANKVREIGVSDAGQFKLRRKPILRNPNLDFIPGDVLAVFPSGMGDALLQSAKLIDRLYDDLGLKPWQLAGRVIRQDECYKLRYEMPGFSKDEVKIKLGDDGILSISGELEEEDAGHGKGQCAASVSLPADAKADEIRAELSDGVLDITIPRARRTDQIPEKDGKSIIH